MNLPPLARTPLSALAVFLSVAVMFVGWWAPELSAGPTVYTYVDDEGTVIFTEQLQSIPERYQDRVQIMADTEGKKAEQKAQEAKEKKAMGGSKPSQPSPETAAMEKAREMVKDMPAMPQSFIPTLSSYQTAVLGIGFGVAVILFVMMKLSHNFGIRLLLRLLLVAVMFGTSYLMYFSGLGDKFAEMTGHAGKEGATSGSKIQTPTEVLQKVRDTIKDMERSQQEKADALQQMEKEP